MNVTIKIRIIQFKKSTIKSNSGRIEDTHLRQVHSKAF